MYMHTWRGGHSGRAQFFFNDTATTEIYTLSLHDALPISFFPLPSLPRTYPLLFEPCTLNVMLFFLFVLLQAPMALLRSEEHTSELQSRQYLVCRLLLEQKNSKTCMSTSPLR